MGFDFGLAVEKQSDEVLKVLNFGDGSEQVLTFYAFGSVKKGLGAMICLCLV